MTIKNLDQSLFVDNDKKNIEEEKPKNKNDFYTFGLYFDKKEVEENEALIFKIAKIFALSLQFMGNIKKREDALVIANSFKHFMINKVFKEIGKSLKCSILLISPNGEQEEIKIN